MERGSWVRPALEIDGRDKGGPPAVQPRACNSRLDTANTFTEGRLTKITQLQEFHLSGQNFLTVVRLMCIS